MQTMYNISLDSYAKVVYIYVNLTEAEYNEVLAYQQETGVQLLYPLID